MTLGRLGRLHSLYRSQRELLPLFKKGAAPHINTIDLGRRGHWRLNVWTRPRLSLFVFEKGEAPVDEKSRARHGLRFI